MLTKMPTILLMIPKNMERVSEQVSAHYSKRGEHISRSVCSTTRARQHIYTRGMDYDSEHDFLYDYASAFKRRVKWTNELRTLSLELRDRSVRLIAENLRQHFGVISDIVTTWVNKRCLAQSFEVSEFEWDAMKRFIAAYIQAAQNANMIDSVCSVCKSLPQKISVWGILGT